MTERKRDPNTGQFLKEVVSWETDWDLDELKFETPDGTAVYKFAGLVPYRKEIRRTTETMRGVKTWETAGYEDVERDGLCVKCRRRVFVCESFPVMAEEEMGDRVVVWKKTGPNEPPQAFCQTCAKEDPDIKEKLDEQLRQDNYVPTPYERWLRKRTEEMGGTVA